MPDAKDFFNRPTHYLICLAGEAGSGKTRAALSFPACMVICCDPAGIEILKDPANAVIAPNLVWYEYFAAEAKAEVKSLFKPTDKPDSTSIYGMIEKAKELARAGQIKTLVIDGYSYLSDLFSAKATVDIPGSTENDRWAYYRQLKAEMTWFTKSTLFTLATRYDLNIIITCHVQREAEQQKEKQAAKDVDIAPRLEGSFRQTLAGMPRAMIYLDQRTVQDEKTKEQRVKYVAYCQRVRVPHMGIVPAKSSYGLAPVEELTNKSLYEILEERMRPASKEAKDAVRQAPASKA
jgi:hypothetical protein